MLTIKTSDGKYAKDEETRQIVNHFLKKEKKYDDTIANLKSTLEIVSSERKPEIEKTLLDVINEKNRFDVEFKSVASNTNDIWYPLLKEGEKEGSWFNKAKKWIIGAGIVAGLTAGVVFAGPSILSAGMTGIGYLTEIGKAHLHTAIDQKLNRLIVGDGVAEPLNDVIKETENEVKVYDEKQIKPLEEVTKEFKMVRQENPISNIKKASKLIKYKNLRRK
jgi:hypothetical protein